MATNRKHPFLNILKAFLLVLITLILIIVIWCTFSLFNKKESISLLPSNYSLYLHTDSIWDALNPIIDLQAADIFLSTPELSQIRETLITFRQSPLRNNKLFAALASRPTDLGLYMNQSNQNIVAVIDMGIFSSVTRLAKIILPSLNIKGLSLVQSDKFYHFEYAMENNVFYIKPHYNTVLISTNFELLQKACQGNNDEIYTPEELALIKKKIDEPIKILADSKNLIDTINTDETNTLINDLSYLLNHENKILISLDIKENKININADIPLEKTESENIKPKIQNINVLLNKPSSTPQILSHLSDIVQYYTILNAGSLQDITSAAFPIIGESTDIESLWEKADSLCKILFSVSLDDLLFSWTGKECAAIGLEGLNAPVFILQIKDETKRRNVFENVLSSVILHDDTSLILNGVRLPKIYLPPFLQNILTAFGVNLPNPYYLVHNGFIYFSESPEVLSTIYNSSSKNTRITNNKNWQAVSSTQKLESTISLFYDLERSEPFFIRGNNIFSKILELYTIGRCDIRIKDSILNFQLSVSTRQAGHLRSIPGFPIQLTEKASQLHIESGNTPSHIFWVENNNTIKSMNINSMQTKELELPSKVSITPTTNKTNSDGILWAVTEEGVVHLFSKDLEEIAGFPIMLESKPSATPIAQKQNLLIPMQTNLCSITPQAKQQILSIPDISGSILATPTVLDDTITFYDKSFLGKIYTLNESFQTSHNIIGIAYGSPALMKKDGNLYTAFITQAGRLYILCDNENLTNFPLEINLRGIFFTNVVNTENYFYALASDGMLYRISLDGTVVAIRIPNSTAKEATLTVSNPNSNRTSNIYISIDGNIIYGFNENLELLSGFPIVGTDKPIFVDINGDGYADCLALTIDNKLNAWNVR